ncbi:MAG: hypothetical protein U9R36_04190, partial [Elusimicrobiota bacterium]|nr:hypothetical protein [Elusimicrobiota bacterium]
NSGDRIKILGTDIYEHPPASPGEIVEVTKKYFAVSARDKCIKVTKVQPAGKRAMDTGAYLAGNDMKAGDRLISSEVE